MNALDAWLATYSSQNTKNVYKSSVGQFLCHVYGEHDPEEYGELSDRYLEERKNDLDQISRDITEWYVDMKSRPPKTIVAYLSAVRMFLQEFRIVLEQGFWVKFKRRLKGPVRALTKDRIPTNKELRQILTHTNTQGRAQFLFLAATGARRGESALVRVEDLYLDESPPAVRIPPFKGSPARWGFLTHEAVEALGEWLKIRAWWMRSASDRFESYTWSPEDDRLFPWGSATIGYRWNRSLEKANLNMKDPDTGRFILHPHTLRKRFKTYLEPYSLAMTEALLGHAGYEGKAYRRTTKEALADFYQRHSSVLLISTDARSLQQIQERTVEREEQIEEMQRQLAELRSQLARLILEKEEGEED